MKVWWNSPDDSWTQPWIVMTDNKEHELVEVCINNMLWEYGLHLEILNIVQFVDLLKKAQRTTLTLSEKKSKSQSVCLCDL